ncbi:MAG: copper homeostasis periplasmic binding protein CopC [Telluria sp.]
MSFLKFAAAAFTLAAAASAAQAHAKLETSDPKAGSTVAAGPRSVRLAFSEALEPAFSKLSVIDSANATVPVQHLQVDGAEPKVMRATMAQLHAGQYRVQWSVVTHDGHRIKGEFSFNVK